MADNILAQHPPALKVGGRRLSISSKPKPHTTEPTPTSPTDPTDPTDPVDYPRPAPPGEDAPPHTEEEVPKKERKHRDGQGNHDEKKLRDLAARKAEATRPTREVGGGKSGFGAAGRIAQPAGKMFV